MRARIVDPPFPSWLATAKVTPHRNRCASIRGFRSVSIKNAATRQAKQPTVRKSKTVIIYCPIFGKRSHNLIRPNLAPSAAGLTIFLDKQARPIEADTDSQVARTPTLGRDMQHKILIIRLLGAGKTTLANAFAQLLNAKSLCKTSRRPCRSS